MSTSSQPPYTYDIVGSFLRPAELKRARAAYAQGSIDRAALTQVEDEAVKDLVAKEKQAGLKAVTDGEFRRGMWHLDFLEALDGVQRIDVDTWPVAFKGPAPKGAQLSFVDRIGFGEHPFLEHYRRLADLADGYPVKFTIPSPTLLHIIPCVRGIQTYEPCERYQDEDALLHDIAAAYQSAIRAFYDQGLRYLQFDDTSWGDLCDLDKRAAYEAQGIDLKRLARTYVELINEALEAKPADMVITTHVCRGNFRSSWFASGGYEPVAEALFGGARYDGFFLEYDSERAGGFEPLRYIRNQAVVLGLVTSKTAELENEEDVAARIDEATKYVPLEQLRLSTQCGFSSTEEGNLITEDDQWAKVALVKRIAERVWG